MLRTWQRKGVTPYKSFSRIKHPHHQSPLAKHVQDLAMKVQSHHDNTHTEETEGNPHLARSHKYVIHQRALVILIITRPSRSVSSPSDVILSLPLHTLEMISWINPLHTAGGEQRGYCSQTPHKTRALFKKKQPKNKIK